MKQENIFSRLVRTITYGAELQAHLALKIWELVPNDIKRFDPLAVFKSAIKKLKPTDCPC